MKMSYENTDGARKGRPGAVRQGSKGKQVGSGGQGRQALEGKRPDTQGRGSPVSSRGKRKAATERYSRRRSGSPGRGATDSRDGRPAAGRARGIRDGPRSRNTDGRRVARSSPDATRSSRRFARGSLRRALYVATRIEVDDRVKEVLTSRTTAASRFSRSCGPNSTGSPGHDSVHQGLALKVPPYEYAHPVDLLDLTISRGQEAAVRRARRRDRSAQPRSDHPLGRGVRWPGRDRAAASVGGAHGFGVEDLGRCRGPHAGRHGGAT